MTNQDSENKPTSFKENVNDKLNTFKDKANNFKNKVVTFFLSLIIITIIGFAIFLLFYNLYSNKEETVGVDSQILITKLIESSELTTAKIKYKGVLEYSGEGTVFIDKTEFLMVYEATARVGIDVKEVEVSVDNENKSVNLIIPKAKIIDVKVDPSSIKYYNQKFKLLNFAEKEEANKAQALAEEQAKFEFEEMGVIENADKQSAILLKGILEETIPDDYAFVVSYE